MYIQDVWGGWHANVHRRQRANTGSAPHGPTVGPHVTSVTAIVVKGPVALECLVRFGCTGASTVMHARLPRFESRHHSVQRRLIVVITTINLLWPARATVDDSRVAVRLVY